MGQQHRYFFHAHGAFFVLHIFRVLFSGKGGVTRRMPWACWWLASALVTNHLKGCLRLMRGDAAAKTIRKALRPLQISGCACKLQDTERQLPGS